MRKATGSPMITMVLGAALIVFASSGEARAQAFSFSIPSGVPALGGAWDVAIDGGGNIYVTGGSMNQVVKLDPTGAELLRFGSPGSADGQFSGPRGIDLDGVGNIYVVDDNNHRVQKFDPSGNFLLSFGSFGVANGQFVSPRGLAVDSMGAVYVTDHGNHRVQKFDSFGNFLLTFGSQGTGDGQLFTPQAVAVDGSDNVYVDHSVTGSQTVSRVQKFDSSGNFLGSFGSSGTGDGQFGAISGISFDPGGDIYVSEISALIVGAHDRVQKFDSSGNFLLSFGSSGRGNGEFFNARGVAVDGLGNVYVVDNFGRVQKFNSNGVFVRSFGTFGTANGLFASPRGVAVDGAGNIYVVERENHRVQKFDSFGSFLLKFGVQGSDDGQFHFPSGIAADGVNIYVADTGNGRLQKFDASGSSFLGAFGTFNEFHGVTLDAAGDVYVADFTGLNGRIQKFDALGNLLLSFNTLGIFDEPADVAVDLAGNIYVALSESIFQTDMIQKFDPSGNLVLSFGIRGTGQGEFDRPRGIAVDSAGDLFVADHTRNIQKFDPSGNFLGSFGSLGGAEGEFVRPWGITVNAADNIYVADTGNHRIQVFAVNGTCPPGVFPIGSDIDGDAVDDACDPCPHDPIDTCDPNSSASGTVGPGGTGTEPITTPDGSVSINVPPGALNDQTFISVTDTGNGTLFALATAAGNGTALFEVDIQPAGLLFNVPITITFSWEDADNDGTIDGTNIREAKLRVLKDGVEIASCSNNPLCDTNANLFVIQVISLSEFTLFVLAEPCLDVDCSSFDTACATASCDEDGAQGNCDILTPEVAGIECRASADVCDVAEVCDGTNVDCPADGFVSAGTECRASAGLCDPAEQCTGAGAACPADAKSTGLCRGSGGVCDPAEVCDGINDACPADAKDSTTVCNAGSGDSCDQDEICDGINDACPVDTITPSGTECRASAGLCDPAEQCTGVADAQCPADAKSTGLCRGSAGECDVDDFCDGVNDDCPADEFQVAGFACSDATDTTCTDPDTCDGLGTCLANNEACALVTDSSLCPFDFNPEKGTCVDSNGDPTGEACDFLDGDPACSAGATCEQIGQFRVVLTPDGKIWPGYKLNASSPGQYFYNLFYEAMPGDTVTLTVTVAYPFVTQGATPVHVYDGASIAGDLGCFVPQQEALQTSNIQIAIEDYIDATFDGVLMCDPPVCGPGGSGACSFQIVDVPIPPSGIVYANLHLDYGLKGKQLDVNPCDDGLADRYDRGPLNPVFGGFDALVDTPNPDLPNAGDGEGAVAIANCTTYAFSHTDDTTPLFVDAIQNLNTFKQISGAYGIAMASDTGSAVPGVWVDLVRVETGEQVGGGVTDEDGFYTITYKHKGKRAMYEVTLNGGHDIAQQIQLRANGWAEVNFDVFTGTSTGEFNLDPNGGGGPGGPGGCTATEDPEVSCNDAVDNDCDGLVDGDDPDCGGGICTLGQQGDSCSSNSDCCSSQCKGKEGNKTCK